MEAIDRAGLTSVPQVSVIIPSLDASRQHHLDALLKDIEGQTFKDLEIKVIRGDPRQGRAINRGVRETNGDIVVIMDDDTRLANDQVIDRLVSCIRSDKRIGMAGASTLIPDWANPLQKRAMKQLPRRFYPLVEQTTDSDMAQHPCCALRREVFLEIGGEREDLIRGLDPYLRQRLRDRGYRVVIAPNCGIYHLLPHRFAGLMRMAFRNGLGSSYAQRMQPDLVFETGDGYEESFDKQISLSHRVGRYPGRIFGALLGGEWIHLCWLGVYAAGYLAGYLGGWRLLKPRKYCAHPDRLE